MNAEKTLQKIKNHLLKGQLLKKAIRHIPRANNIRNRLLLAVSLLILISATSLSVLNYLHFASSYTEQSAENMQELVEQVAVNIENSLNEIGQLCLSPYYNSDIILTKSTCCFSTSTAPISCSRSGSGCANTVPAARG